MPRKITPAEINHAKRLYASGKSFDQVAAILGRKSSEGIRVALQRHGVKPRPRPAIGGHNRIEAAPDVLARYNSGESVYSMSVAYGVSCAVVDRWLEEEGVSVRSMREAQALRQKRVTPAERRALTRAANEAIRSMGPRPDEWQERIAKGRERTQYGGRASPGTDTLCELLDRRGVPYVREKAVGRYNIDIALPESHVAVEVLGGNWHGSKPIHATRTPYILNAGWNIVFVWDIQRCKVSAAALEYILTYAYRPGLNPSSLREYRVIRGDGKVLSVGKADDDEFPLVRPSVADLR